MIQSIRDEARAISGVEHRPWSSTSRVLSALHAAGFHAVAQTPALMRGCIILGAISGVVPPRHGVWVRGVATLTGSQGGVGLLARCLVG